MQYRLCLPAMAALALSSTQVYALQLGDINASTYIGETLSAEVPVTLKASEKGKKISVGLASAGAFRQAGLNLNDVVRSLRFSVHDSSQGNKLIRVSSTRPISEPFVDILVTVALAGQDEQTHELILLLDPQGSGASPVATTEGRQQVTKAKPVTAQNNTKPAPPSARPHSVRVRRGDTLYGIAERYGVPGFSVHQVVEAIHELNPKAFINNNINGLKSGAELDLPSEKQTAQHTAAQAKSFIDQQRQTWQNRHAPNAQVAEQANQPSGNGNAEGEGQTASIEDQDTRATQEVGQANDSLQLKIPSKEDNLVVSEDQKTDGNTASTDGDVANRQWLDDARTQIQIKNNEIANLRAALKAAQEQLSGMSGEVKGYVPGVDGPYIPDGLLRTYISANAMDLGSTKASGLAGATDGFEQNHADGQITDLNAVDLMEAGTDESSESDAQIVNSSTQPEQSENEPAEAYSQPSTSKQTPNEPWYTSLWIRFGALLVAILALLGLVWNHRRRKQMADEDLWLDAGLSDDEMSHAYDHDNLFEDDSSLQDTSDATDEGQAEPMIQPVTRVDYQSSDANEESDLQLRLQQEPENLSLYLEVASMHYLNRDTNAFLDTAKAMHEHVTDPMQDEWKEMCEMGRELVPQHPWFSLMTVVNADGGYDYPSSEPAQDAQNVADPTGQPVEENTAATISIARKSHDKKDDLVWSGDINVSSAKAEKPDSSENDT